MTNDIEHHSVSLFAFCISLFGEVSLYIFCAFFIGLFLITFLGHHPPLPKFELDKQGNQGL